MGWGDGKPFWEIDWNPLHSSAFTGAGTFWGPSETAKPEYHTPNLETAFVTDPMQIHGFDYSPLRKQMAQNILNQFSKSREQSLAQLQRAGIQGADTSRALTDISSGQAGAMAGMEANLGMMDWRDRERLMQTMNEAMKQRNAYKLAQAQQEYQGQLQARHQEEVQRNQFWKTIGNIAGMIPMFFGAPPLPLGGLVPAPPPGPGEPPPGFENWGDLNIPKDYTDEDIDMLLSQMGA